MWLAVGGAGALSDSDVNEITVTEVARTNASERQMRIFIVGSNRARHYR
jgi:hypothetical protein